MSHVSRNSRNVRSDCDDEADFAFHMLSKLHYSRTNSQSSSDDDSENRPIPNVYENLVRKLVVVNDIGEVKLYNPESTVRAASSSAITHQTSKTSEIQKKEAEGTKTIATKLTTLITKDYCYLCKINIAKHTKHYDNAGHFIKVGEWIEGELIKAKEPVDHQKLIFCQVCNIPLSGNENALSHYSGQKHKKKEKSFCIVCHRMIDAADMKGHNQSKQHMKKIEALRKRAVMQTLRIKVEVSKNVPTKETLEVENGKDDNKSSFYPFSNPMKVPIETLNEQPAHIVENEGETSSTTNLVDFESTKTDEATTFEENSKVNRNSENNEKVTPTNSSEMPRISQNKKIIEKADVGIKTSPKESPIISKQILNCTNLATDQEPNNIKLETTSALQETDNFDNISKINDKSVKNDEKISNEEILICQKLIDVLQIKNKSSYNLVYLKHYLKNVIETDMTDDIKFAAEISKFKSITSKSLNTKEKTDFSVIRLRIFAILTRNFSTFLTNSLTENPNNLSFQDVFTLSKNDSFSSNLFSYSLIFDVFSVAKITLRDECTSLETFARNYQGTDILKHFYEFNQKLLIIFDECFLINDVYRLSGNKTTDLEAIINQYFAINKIHCLWSYIKNFKMFLEAKTLKHFEAIFECNIEFLENIDYKKNIRKELKAIWDFIILEDFFNHFAIFKWKLLVILKGHLWNANTIHNNNELEILRDILNTILHKPNRLGQPITNYLKNLKLAILNRYQLCGGFEQHDIFLVEPFLEKPLILNLFKLANEWDIYQLNVYKEFDDLCNILSKENDNFAMDFLLKFNEELVKILEEFDYDYFEDAMECSCAGLYCMGF